MSSSQVAGRTKTQARKSTGAKTTKIIWSKWINHQITFKDHNGKSAIMAWHAIEAQRVPTLPAWICYMVNPEISHGFNARKFCDSFEKDHTYYSEPFRYEFFFLPGATPEECVAHYHKELAARGTMWPQIRKAWAPIKEKRAAEREKCKRQKAEAGDSAQEPSDDENEECEHYDRSMDRYYAQDDEEPQANGPNEQNLPGLPWAKGSEVCGHRQWLLMCTDDEVKWGPAIPGRNEQALNIRVVKFDPVPFEEEEDRARWDPMEHPIVVKQDPELWFTCWASDRGHGTWANHSIYATQHATELGWETW
ncbi:hypothetical protein FLONG3_4927 [Fusarium longipes]|uniref:Uncharacterized protein n=1 Tax=Fusarium longipes TaxID=694270 RepID=A0A395SXZ9_9HYPO|nr:hypothetical protein FLONG3_4927 [Fusarium longipes]